MLIFLLIAIFVIFLGAKRPASGGKVFPNYLDREQSTAIKGAFILLIFVSHGEDYLLWGDGLADRIYALLRMGLGQSVVTLFFFYSGYGIGKAMLERRDSYLTGFPRHRFLKTLLHFDLAVLLYLLYGLAVGYSYAPGEVLLALIGWTSLGNSAWFIFDILVAYLLAYLGFALFGKGDVVSAGGESGAPGSTPGNASAGKGPFLFVSLASLAFVVLMVFVQDTIYYNTFLCFSLGLWWAYGKERIDRQLLPSPGRILGLLAALMVLYLVGGLLLRPVYEGHEYLYIPLPLLFCVATVLLTMLLRLSNPLLQFFGRHLFTVYILMRLPMLLLHRLGMGTSPFLFYPLALAATVILAVLYDALLARLDARLNL